MGTWLARSESGKDAGGRSRGTAISPYRASTHGQLDEQQATVCGTLQVQHRRASHDGTRLEAASELWTLPVAARDVTLSLNSLPVNCSRPAHALGLDDLGCVRRCMCGDHSLYVCTVYSVQQLIMHAGSLIACGCAYRYCPIPSHPIPWPFLSNMAFSRSSHLLLWCSCHVAVQLFQGLSATSSQ